MLHLLQSRPITNLPPAPLQVRKTPSWPRSWANFSLDHCIPTGMHGPTCIFWANLTPFSPQDLDWSPPFPAKQMMRRQIVENMPDPLCPLFEELYLIDGRLRRGPSAIGPPQSPLYGESLSSQEMSVTNNSAPSYVHTGQQEGLRRASVRLGFYPIYTLEQRLPNMIGNLV